MEKSFDSIKKLLKEHGSISITLLSSCLKLTIEDATELAKSFTERSKDYSLLYNAEYNAGPNDFRMCTVTSEELKDLLSKHKDVKSHIYAIRKNSDDLKDVYKQMFEHTLKLSQQEMCKSFENNELYIPEFVNLRISDIKMRTFMKSVPSDPYIKEEKAKPEPFKAVKNEIEIKDDTVSGDEVKPMFVVKEYKRKTPPKKDKPSKPKPQLKKLKVESENEVQDVEMENNLFDDDEIIEVDNPEEPKTIKFVEKVSKTNTYVENGYYVLEEADDYVEVVKETPRQEEGKEKASNDSKSESTANKAGKGVNGKKAESTKATAPSKKMAQSSIMSFFKK